MTSKRNKVAIIGDAGHAVDVADIALADGYDDIVFLGTEKKTEGLAGFPLLKDDIDTVNRLHGEGYVFAIGIGSSRVRKKIANKYAQLTFPNIIHPSVTFGNIQHSSLEGKTGNVFAAGCRLTNNIHFGDFCFLGVNSTIGHDCRLGDFSSVMPGAVISGNVSLGECCYIGANASIIQGAPGAPLIIGKDSTIGMGAVVTRDIPEAVTAVGVPAQPVKK
ncbi:acetyltransferase [Emcibacter sp.]|uniref:acetyltransferase n=1 Tax=Emcibacter sp. TaxID=1979954 RepID=UPI003A900F7C